MLRSAIISFIILVSLSTPCLCEQFKALGTIDSYFSPNGRATEAIVKVINAAKSEILVQAYSFTSKPIAKALVATFTGSFCVTVNRFFTQLDKT